MGATTLLLLRDVAHSIRSDGTRTVRDRTRARLCGTVRSLLSDVMTAAAGTICMCIAVVVGSTATVVVAAVRRAMWLLQLQEVSLFLPEGRGLEGGFAQGSEQTVDFEVRCEQCRLLQNKKLN